jgi:hypothetical protein
MSAYTRAITATIAINTSLSAAVFIGGEFSLVGILYPAAWTAAGLSFQVSFDGVTYHVLRDDAGTEITKGVTAGQFRYLDPTEFMSAIYLKLQSGTSGTPVNQLAARTLTLYTRRYAAR